MQPPLAMAPPDASTPVTDVSIKLESTKAAVISGLATALSGGLEGGRRLAVTAGPDSADRIIVGNGLAGSFASPGRMGSGGGAGDCRSGDVRVGTDQDRSPT